MNLLFVEFSVAFIDTFTNKTMFSTMDWILYLLLAPQGLDIHKLSIIICLYHHHNNHHHPIHILHCCYHHHNNCPLSIAGIHIPLHLLLAPQDQDIHKPSRTMCLHHNHSNRPHPIHILHCCFHHRNNCHL